MDTSVHATESAVVSTLIQLIVIILCARVAGTLARMVRQPRTVGEVIAGLLLGPSLFGHLFPDLSGAIFNAEAATPVLILSQIGLILLMFQIGSEFEFGHLRESQNKRAVLYVAIASICVPLATGLLLGWWTAPILAPGIDGLTYCLFVGVAFAITAVPVLGRILREYSMTRTETGVIAITAAAANDVVGWLALAGVAAYASAQFSASLAAYQIGGILLLLLALWFIGRPVVDWLIRRFPSEDGQTSNSLLAIVIALVFLAGIGTEKLGIFTIFGGFLLGLLFHRHPEFVAGWRRQVGQFVLIFFLPIFFTYTGLRTNVAGLDSVMDWVWCGGIILAAVAAKILPVYFASRLAGLGSQQSAILGALMNTRGLMELIVLNVGLSLGFVPPNVFTMLVIMAVVTTIMTGPVLQIMLPKVGHRVDKLIEA